MIFQPPANKNTDASLKVNEQSKDGGTPNAGDLKAQKDSAAENTRLTQEFQGESQQFSMMSNAFNTAIKAIGESLGKSASKQ